MTETDTPIRMLLVEDNPTDVLLLQSMLQHQGRYEVCEASSLASAKRAVLEHAYDVAFVDLSLPDSYGLETVEALRKSAPDLPIIVLTGVTDEEVALAAVSRGAQDYLVKGQAQADMLSRAVRYAIDRKQAEVSLRKAHNELERRVQERTADLRRANRILQMIAECNQALVHFAEEGPLAEAICGIFHRLGGFPLVRVSYVEDEESQRLRVAASAGRDPDRVETSASTRSVCECSFGPTAKAVMLGRAWECRDLLADSEPAAWREFAARSGFRSLFAFPLVSEGRAFGALTVFSDKSELLDESLTETLHALTDDLAFAIVAIRTRSQRDRAERALEQRAGQLSALAAELTQAEQRERRRLARILHDNLQQSLVGARYTVDVARTKTKSKAALEAMSQLSHSIEESIQTARSLTAELSPPALYEKGLSAGLEWLGRRMHESHGLRVEIEADSEAEPSSEHIRMFLFEAVRELLFNVVKHSGVKEARVRLLRTEQEICVEVSDTGAGFDPARPRSEDRMTGGLGLFGIRERIGFLDGQVITESAPGKGSRITLVVKAPPLSDTRRDETAADGKTADAARGQRRKIRVLIADDHVMVRQGLCSLLRGEPDIEIVGEAADGQAAVEMARHLRPDVIVMDVSMPRMDGCQATRIIAKELPGSRVVALSMHEEIEFSASMLKAGAAAYLTKGGPAQALIAAIRVPIKDHQDVPI